MNHDLSRVGVAYAVPSRQLSPGIKCRSLQMVPPSHWDFAAARHLPRYHRNDSTRPPRPGPNTIRSARLAAYAAGRRRNRVCRVAGRIVRSWAGCFRLRAADGTGWIEGEPSAREGRGERGYGPTWQSGCTDRSSSQPDVHAGHHRRRRGHKHCGGRRHPPSRSAFAPHVDLARPGARCKRSVPSTAGQCRPVAGPFDRDHPHAHDRRCHGGFSRRRCPSYSGPRCTVAGRGR